MSDDTYTIKPVGVIHSELISRKQAPRQGDQGAPDARVEIKPEYIDALDGIMAGSEIILITWLHQSDREVLKLHPRGDENNPLTGVFATRSPARPNPIGLHRVAVLEITGNRLKVAPLEAIDGTPVVDIKPVIIQGMDF